MTPSQRCLSGGNSVFAASECDPFPGVLGGSGKLGSAGPHPDPVPAVLGGGVDSITLPLSYGVLGGSGKSGFASPDPDSDSVALGGGGVESSVVDSDLASFGGLLGGIGKGVTAVSGPGSVSGGA